MIGWRGKKVCQLSSTKEWLQTKAAMVLLQRDQGFSYTKTSSRVANVTKSRRLSLRQSSFFPIIGTRAK